MFHTWHRPRLLDTAVSVTKCDTLGTDPGFLAMQSVSPNVIHLAQTQASWQCTQCHQMWRTWHRPRLLDTAVSVTKCDTWHRLGLSVFAGKCFQSVVVGLMSRWRMALHLCFVAEKKIKFINAKSCEDVNCIQCPYLIIQSLKTR